jgi:drug/metabolite transporter (DMT)-like permease
LLASFVSGNYKLQLLRSALLVTTTALFFTGLRTTALSTATVIMFLSPILVTLLAIPLLGEKVGVRRLIGVLIGFMGAVVIIHPRADSGLALSAQTVVSDTISWLPELGHLLIGAALIISSGLYIFYREHVLSKSMPRWLFIQPIVAPWPVTAELPEWTPEH